MMSDIETLFNDLKEAGPLYLATVDGDQPKARPLGFRMLENNQIYFITGKFKDAYKQMLANPKVEFVGTVDGKIIRYIGEATFDDDEALLEKAYEIMPMLKEMFSAPGLEPAIFHLENAKAEYKNMMEVEKTIEF